MSGKLGMKSAIEDSEIFDESGFLAKSPSLNFILNNLFVPQGWDVLENLYNLIANRFC